VDSWWRTLAPGGSHHQLASGFTVQERKPPRLAFIPVILVNRWREDGESDLVLLSASHLRLSLILLDESSARHGWTAALREFTADGDHARGACGAHQRGEIPSF
jgi:hypothetical protein